MRFTPTFSESNQKINVGFTEEKKNFTTSFNGVVKYKSNEAYKGNYKITPSSESQVLSTKELMMIDDLVIEPIPKNYGLIEWNGSGLSIS